MAQTNVARIVHESEAQRQFVRLKLPASIEFTTPERTKKTFQLYDISAGGFSFDPLDDSFRTGAIYSGAVALKVDSVGFTIPVTFQVVVTDPKVNRIGCRLQDVGTKETAALRQILTAFLAGELVSTGEMLNTLGRDNTARARGAATNNSLSVGGKIRALIGTAIALGVGVVAFGYASFKLYDLVFVTHATAAKVAVTSYTITMPRDGTFFPLVKKDTSIKKGQPVGQFQTALLEVVEGVSGSFRLTPDQLSQLVGEQLKGSLASPCDCVVQNMFVTDGQYVLRNQSVLELVPEGADPYVLARFHYNQMKQLSVGSQVTMRVNGSKTPISGEVESLRILPAPTVDSNGLNDLNGLNTNAAITDFIAVIKPSIKLSRVNLDDPVEVYVDPLFGRVR